MPESKGRGRRPSSGPITLEVSQLQLSIDGPEGAHPSGLLLITACRGGVVVAARVFLPNELQGRVRRRRRP